LNPVVSPGGVLTSESENEEVKLPRLKDEIHVRASWVKDVRESSPCCDLIGESTGCGGQLLRFDRLGRMMSGSQRPGDSVRTQPSSGPASLAFGVI
jgi:hypothetical protein